MAEIKFQKVNTLPQTLTPDTVYFVKKGTAVEIRLSNSDGSTSYPVTSGEEEIHPFMLMGASGD